MDVSDIFTMSEHSVLLWVLKDIQLWASRGPVQMTFARSIDPIVPLNIPLLEWLWLQRKKRKNKNNENRTIGRKHTVPYGLYRAHGFISAHLAKQTGFSEQDLDLFWESLKMMFDHDHSAARGMMSVVDFLFSNMIVR